MDKDVMREFYNTNSKEILQIQEESKGQNQTDSECTWFALERTAKKISKDLDLER